MGVKISNFGYLYTLSQMINNSTWNSNLTQDVNFSHYMPIRTLIREIFDVGPSEGPYVPESQRS